jgi:hypothetical protein
MSVFSFSASENWKYSNSQTRNELSGARSTIQTLITGQGLTLIQCHLTLHPDESSTQKRDVTQNVPENVVGSFVVRGVGFEPTDAG